MAQRFRSPTPGDTLSEAKPTFTREFPGEAGGASRSPLGLQRCVILSQACHSWPTLHSRRLDRAARRDLGLCDRRQGPAPLWASC